MGVTRPASRVGDWRGARAHALHPIVFGTIRQADEDIELAGVCIPAGPGARQHSGGVHYCLGSHLARRELTEALRVIPQRMPNPRRTGPAPWKAIGGFTGPATLPLEFYIGH